LEIQPLEDPTGIGNVMVGYNSGGTCEDGSNNTFLGTNTQLHPGEQLLSGSIALGAGAVISNYYQPMVAWKRLPFLQQVDKL